VDIQGVPVIKQKYPNSICLFISAPNFEILEKRLRGRGKDSEEVIQKRLKTAKEEMKDAEQNPIYDHIIINEEGKLDQTANRVVSIIKNYALK